MTTYGKKCAQCNVYFISPRQQEKFCPWCMQDGSAMRKSEETSVRVDATQAQGEAPSPRVV